MGKIPKNYDHNNIRLSIFNKIKEAFGYDLFTFEEMEFLRNPSKKMNKIENTNSSGQIENNSTIIKEKTSTKFSVLENFEKISNIVQKSNKKNFNFNFSRQFF